jgi:phosphate acetyltransferase
LAIPQKVVSYANEHELKHIEKATIIDPELFDKSSAYADLMVELRKKKGMTREQALELLSNPLHLATMMIKNGDADGEVAGARNATGDVLRPAFSVCKDLTGHQCGIGRIFDDFARRYLRRKWLTGICRLRRTSRS